MVSCHVVSHFRSSDRVKEVSSLLRFKVRFDEHIYIHKNVYKNVFTFL